MSFTSLRLTTGNKLEALLFLHVWFELCINVTIEICAARTSNGKWLSLKHPTNRNGVYLKPTNDMITIPGVSEIHVHSAFLNNIPCSICLCEVLHCSENVSISTTNYFMEFLHKTHTHAHTNCFKLCSFLNNFLFPPCFIPVFVQRTAILWWWIQ